MQLVSQPSKTSNILLWSGRILTLLAAAFLAFDTIVKVFEMAPAVEATTQLGYQQSAVFGIGVVQLICLVLYLIPRTSTLGAILFTGYLGGAISTHLLAGSDWFSLLFPVIVGLMLWGGLFLRDEHLRQMIPLRR